jgi:hypothetical protein
MTDEDIKKVSDSINSQFFLIPRRRVIYWFGGFVGALAAIFGLGWATLRAPEIREFITRVRANAEESDRLVTQLKASKDVWNAAPQRLSALETGDFNPIDGPHFTLSFNTADRVAHRLGALPKDAHQILARFWIATGSISTTGANQLTLSVIGPSNNELKFPLFLFTYHQDAYSYYSHFLWIPAPKDLNIYTQFDKVFIGSGTAGIDIIGWK